MHVFLIDPPVPRYLLAHVDRMSDIASQTITELGMASKRLVTVPPEKSAIEALKIMHDSKVGALALVNSEGQISGTFSATDMRWVSFEVVVDCAEIPKQE